MSEGAGVQGLHQQRADAAHDRREPAVHGPRGRSRAEVALVLPVGELLVANEAQTYLADVITRIVNGHPNSCIDELGRAHV